MPDKETINEMEQHEKDEQKLLEERLTDKTAEAEKERILKQARQYHWRDSPQPIRHCERFKSVA